MAAYNTHVHVFVDVGGYNQLQQDYTLYIYMYTVHVVSTEHVHVGTAGLMSVA